MYLENFLNTKGMEAFMPSICTYEVLFIALDNLGPSLHNSKSTYMVNDMCSCMFLLNKHNNYLSFFKTTT